MRPVCLPQHSLVLLAPDRPRVVTEAVLAADLAVTTGAALEAMTPPVARAESRPNIDSKSQPKRNQTTNNERPVAIDEAFIHLAEG